MYLKSIIESAKRVKKLNPIKRDAKLRENLAHRVKKIKPEISSISGYCSEILVLQKEHFPFKNIQEKRGILCQGFSGVLHAGQCEETKTTLSSFGRRKITTFKNEPISVPKIKESASSTILSPRIFSQFL